MSIYKRILRLIYWSYFEVIWALRRIRPQKHGIVSNRQFSIGITTYKDRFDAYFKSLLERISLIFPDTEVIVAANGHYDTEGQNNYLHQLEELISHYPKVKLIKFLSPQGLSKLWNSIILTTSNDRIFILNDDIRFSPYLRKKIELTNFFNERIAIINNSFSFFMLSKELAMEVGGFDERFLEIGGEDDDFCVRLAILGYAFPVAYSFEFIENFHHKPKINSFGKEVSKEANMYSNYNIDFLYKKWEMSNTKFDGSVLSRYAVYWKLRPGMETPNFLNQERL